MPLSSESGQAALLHFRQRSAATDVGYDAERGQDGQCLEQVPGGVVEEEDAFDGDDRAEEEPVGQRRVRERFGEVCEVAANLNPLGVLSVLFFVEGVGMPTSPSKMGSVARAASVETATRTMFGLVGSDRKMW